MYNRKIALVGARADLIQFTRFDEKAQAVQVGTHRFPAWGRRRNVAKTASGIASSESLRT